MATLFIHGSSDLYGSAKILLQVVAICVEEKEEVVVVLPHSGVLVSQLEKLGAIVYIINIGVLRRRYFTPWGMLGRIFLWIYASYKISKLIRARQVSKIYVNSANVVIGPFLKRITRLPLIWHLHEIVEKPSILRMVLTKLIIQADLVIAVSSATQRFWISQSKEMDIKLLYNGIDCAAYYGVKDLLDVEFPFTLKKEKNATIIGMIGRIQPWKGQAYFLDVMKIFYQQYSSNVNPVYAVIIGDPYPGYEHYASELTFDIEKKGLSQNVFYLGYRDDIPAILASIDLLMVSSTLPDPLPTVILEAMASAKPVISTRQGGALEMVLENKTGFFIPLNDPQQSANILHKVLTRQKDFLQLGMNGYERVQESFSLSAFKRSWLNLFQSL